MLKALLKIAVVVLLIKELWLLLQIPTVADAIFSFIMVGQVPGTDTTLSPDQMMWFLAVVFVLAAALIFRKEVAMLLRRLRRRAPATTHLAPAVMPITPPTQAGPAPKVPADRIAALASRRSALVARGRYIGRVCAEWLAPRLHTARSYASKGAAKAGAWIRILAIYTWKVLLVVYILVSALAITGWQRLRPRLERFDHWLDVKLHQNEHTAAVLAVGSDMQRTVARWWAEFKSLDDKKPGS